MAKADKKISTHNTLCLQLSTIFCIEKAAKAFIIGVSGFINCKIQDKRYGYFTLFIKNAKVNNEKLDATRKSKSKSKSKSKNEKSYC
jgi:hypothetical protein